MIVADPASDGQSVEGLRLAIVGSRGYPSTYGGFETLVRYLAPYLRDEGAEVTVYGRERPCGSTLKDGIRVVNTRGLSTKSLSTLSHGLTAAIHASKERFDAVIVLNIANGYFLPLIRRRRTVTILNVDGMEWERAKWNGLARAVFRVGGWLSARWSDELVADSREIARRWRDLHGRELTFIPYGAEIPMTIGQTKIASLGLKAASYHLMVARLVPENNIALFLSAASDSPSDYRFVLVGSGDLDRASQDQLASLTRSGRVVALGHVSDQGLLTELWANSASYFHGHSAGGTNPALLQAMSCGAPVVAFDSAYNREVLGDGSCFVAQPADLVSAWTSLESASPDHVDAERQRFQGIISERYTWSSVCAGYASLVTDAVGRASQRRSLPSLGAAQE